MAEFITATKKAELEAELLHLKTIKRPEIGERVQTARALGDLSENAEYHAARDDQGKNETRIQQIEYVLKHSQIIERSGNDRVEIGATVTIRKEGSDDDKIYMIVSDSEADIAQGKISTSSPLGSAMLEKRTGESFTMTTPKGEITYAIISVK